MRAALLVGLCMLPAAAAVQARRGAPMKELSEGFRRLERALDAGDLRGVGAAAAEVAALAQEPFELPAEVEGASPELFQERMERLGGLARELAERAAADDLYAAAGAFVELRASCVSCHVRFRSRNEERGNFPSRANTVTGQVELFDTDGQPLEDRSWVLVFLDGGPPAPAQRAYRPAQISQRGRRFEPRVLPVQVGAEVQFPNDDTIFHNVFSLSKTAPFDLGVYEPGQSAAVRMERSGLVKIYCNIHPEMTSSIVVLDNPWYALCDPDGHFVISEVPDGEYQLRGWNDRGAESRQAFTVAGNRLHETRVQLRETSRKVSHPNKYGKPYPAKY